MAKKSTRHIPTMAINVKGNGKPDIDSLCENIVFTKAVFKETVEGIKDAINNKKKTAILFNLDESNYYIEIDKSQWKQALQTCMDLLVEQEDYLACSSIKKLIDKIK
jgi:hypothetical protein